MRDEEKRQRKLASEVIWPFLVANTKSINDAEAMLHATTMAIQGNFDKKVQDEQKRVSALKLSELEVEKTLKTDKEYDRERKLLDLLKDETIAVSSHLISGMKTVIGSFVREETSHRELASLKTQFLE